MNKEQLKQHDRLKKYIAREQLYSVLNDTKWRKLFNNLQPFAGSFEYLRSDLKEEKATENWIGDFYYSFAGWDHIHWLRIRPNEHSEGMDLLQLTDIVVKTGVPFTQSENYIEVWGYLYPGEKPEWYSI